MRARCIALTATVVAVFATQQPAGAQRPTSDDVEEMFPSSVASSQHFSMPYYKWASGTPVSVQVVTDGQQMPCVDMIALQLRRQVVLIRELIPELRNLRYPELTDWIPKTQIEAPLLLGLAMNREAGQAMADYGAALRPHAQHYGDAKHYGDSITGGSVFAQGFGTEHGRIVYAYWSLNSRGGLKGISDDTCRKSRWDVAGLISGLGGVKFRVINSRWGQRMGSAGARKDVSSTDGLWLDLMERLFLKALYACPGSPASEDCLKRTVKALVADPSVVPRE